MVVLAKVVEARSEVGQSLSNTGIDQAIRGLAEGHSRDG